MHRGSTVSGIASPPIPTDRRGAEDRSTQSDDFDLRFASCSALGDEVDLCRAACLRRPFFRAVIAQGPK